MLMDVYYAKYTNPDGSIAKVNMEDKTLPYLVQFDTVHAMEQFMQKLQREYFTCVSANQSYRHLFVNLDFGRFAVIEKACKHSCVDDRTYTEEEFLKEVYEPWQRHEHKDLSPVIWEMDGDKYAVALMSMALWDKFEHEMNKIQDAAYIASETKTPMPPRSEITPLPVEFKMAYNTVTRFPYTDTTLVLGTNWFSNSPGDIYIEHRYNWDESRFIDHTNKKDLFNVMPILIPLDKDGHPSREIFRSEPNGALTRGGSLYYIQGGRTNVWDGDGDPIRVKHYDTKTAWVGDSHSDDELLEWMFWDGCLVAMRPILQLRPCDIWASGLARIDIDHLPGAVLEDDPIPEPEEVIFETN